MAGWHHQLDGHEFEWTAGVSDGQGSLACCNSWDCKVRHDRVTELNWKSVIVSIVFPPICHEVMGVDAMIFIFECWVLIVFSLSSFTFIKGLFSSSSLSAIRMVSSAYLRLLIFLLAILIPACASSIPGFWMIYCAYKLNQQGDNIPPWHTHFPILSQFVVPCLVLTVASWSAYRFIHGSETPFDVSFPYCHFPSVSASRKFALPN